MPDFLTTLAQRTLKMVPVIQPIIAPLFSSDLPVAFAPVEEETWNRPDHALEQASIDSTSILPRTTFHKPHKANLHVAPTETSSLAPNPAIVSHEQSEAVAQRVATNSLSSHKSHEAVSHVTPIEASPLVPSPSDISHDQVEAVAQRVTTNSLSQPTLTTQLPLHKAALMRFTSQEQEEGITDASNLANQPFPLDENIGETFVLRHSPDEHITLLVPSSGSIISGQHVQKPLEAEKVRDKYPPMASAQIATGLPERDKQTDIYTDNPLVPEFLSHDSEHLYATTYPDQDSANKATTLPILAGETSMSKEMEISHSLQPTEAFGSSSLLSEDMHRSRSQLAPLPISQHTQSQSFLLIDEHKVVRAESSDIQHLSHLDATASQQKSEHSTVERLLVPDNADMPLPQQSQHTMQVNKRDTNNILASTSHLGIIGEQERSSRVPAAEIVEAASRVSMQSNPSPVPTVHITIGRIDVRAITTHAPETRQALDRTRSQLSLDDYLNGQNKGGR